MDVMNLRRRLLTGTNINLWDASNVVIKSSYIRDDNGVEKASSNYNYTETMFPINPALGIIIDTGSKITSLRIYYLRRDGSMIIRSNAMSSGIGRVIEYESKIDDCCYIQLQMYKGDDYSNVKLYQ